MHLLPVSESDCVYLYGERGVLIFGLKQSSRASLYPVEDPKRKLKALMDHAKTRHGAEASFKRIHQKDEEGNHYVAVVVRKLDVS